MPSASAVVEVPFSPEPDELGETLDCFARADDVGDAVGQHDECEEGDNEVSATLTCDVVE